jgi:broad specificity phosphatase PhoE
MRALILVRHSISEVDKSVDSNQWHLSAAGRLLCEPLAERLAEYSPTRIVTSREPKAIETGQIIAEILNKPESVANNIHEHDRSGMGIFPTVEAFQANVENFFRHPNELVYGNETGEETYQRFVGALTDLLEQYPYDTLAAVTHGTVLSLFVARAARLDPYTFWQRLGMPSYVVLSLPDLKVIEVVEKIEAPVPG